MQTATRYQFQRIPKPGQSLIAVELSALQHHTIDQALEKLEQLGYKPELRYAEGRDGLCLYALLRDEQFDSAEVIDDRYRLDERIALFEAFPDDEMAVHSSRGLPRRQPVAA